MEAIHNGGKKYFLAAMIKKTPITRSLKIVITASGEFIKINVMNSHPKMSHTSAPIG